MRGRAGALRGSGENQLTAREASRNHAKSRRPRSQGPSPSKAGRHSAALAGALEASACVLANRLQHREARFVGAFLLTKKALIQQRYEIVERRTADLLGGRGVNRRRKHRDA